MYFERSHYSFMRIVFACMVHYEYVYICVHMFTTVIVYKTPLRGSRIRSWDSNPMSRFKLPFNFVGQLRHNILAPRVFLPISGSHMKAIGIYIIEKYKFYPI